MKQIYFDNTATSFPKPPGVIEAMNDYMLNVGANTGRGGHKAAMGAGQIVFRARKKLADMFGVKNPMHVIFGFNATDALNLAIKGVVREGDHVITSSMEHNSVIRPLNELKNSGVIELSIVQANEKGIVDVGNIEKEIKANTTTLVLNHVSNVCSCEQKISAMGALAKKYHVTLIVDGAQSAGVVPLNLNEAGISLFAFTGHKSLFGPQGVGGLVIADDFDYKKVKPLKQGGTGSLSDQTVQPDFLPDCFESGTMNIGGIAGLSAGIDFINSKGLDFIYNHEKELLSYFVKNANEKVDGFHAIGYSENSINICSFNVDGISVSELTQTLSEVYGIMCRQGLHCAPLAHETLGSYPDGSCRFGFNILNTKEEIDRAIVAMIEIKRKLNKTI